MGADLHPFLQHPGVLAFAHRGGTGDWPENTMSAFAHAVGLGFTYLETDVHLTADGVVIAFHDSSLDRVSDSVGLISELSWEEVSRARISGTEGVPRLTDLLAAFPGARVNIDPKDDAVVEALVEVIKAHEPWIGCVSVRSPTVALSGAANCWVLGCVRQPGRQPRPASVWQISGSLSIPRRGTAFRCR